MRLGWGGCDWMRRMWLGGGVGTLAVGGGPHDSDAARMGPGLMSRGPPRDSGLPSVTRISPKPVVSQEPGRL